MKLLLALAAAATSARAYWLMGIGLPYSFGHGEILCLSPSISEDFITTERIDPIVNPGKVASHVHSGKKAPIRIFFLQLIHMAF